MKSAKDYSDELAKIQHTNDILALQSINARVGANYANKCVLKGELEVEQIDFIQYTEQSLVDQGEKRPTSAWLHQQWNATDRGKELIMLACELKGMEAIIASVKNHIVLLSYQRKDSENQ